MPTDPVTLRPRLLSYGHQSLDESDKKAVLEVLSGEWLTQGPAVDRFESSLQRHLGAAHAVTCANGTAALHLAALALGWAPGDVIIVPAITFLASANCALFVGAEPHFVDIAPDTLTIDPNEVERHIVNLLASGRRVRGIVGVDIAGHPCDWPALRQLADRFDLALVDDACHAMGAEYYGEKVGACAHADVTVLSFHPVKHITTAEGGAVLTNDAAMAEHLRRLRCHGTVRAPGQVEGWEGPWHADMVELGYNYRLSDLQCALGSSQMVRLSSFVTARRRIAAQYDSLLAGSPWFRHPVPAEWARHAYHLYLVRAQFSKGGLPDRREFFRRCLDRHIQLQVHYRPVPLNSFYQGGRTLADIAACLPVSMAYYRETFSIPMFPDLTSEDVAYVLTSLNEAAEA